jgi:CheY-like chemotaxis protein
MNFSCPQCQSVLDTPADLHESGEEFLCTQCHTLLKLVMKITAVESLDKEPPVSAPTHRIVAAFHGEASLDVVRELLASLGYDVLMVKTGREVIASVDQLQPSVVILEDELPDLSGLDVCELLKRSKRHHGLRVIRVAKNRETVEASSESALLYGPDTQIVRSSLFRDLEGEILTLVQQQPSGSTIPPEPANPGRVDPDATRLMTEPKGPPRHS